MNCKGWHSSSCPLPSCFKAHSVFGESWPPTEQQNSSLAMDHHGHGHHAHHMAPAPPMASASDSNPTAEAAGADSMHAGHDMNNHVMAMFFHAGFKEVILFDTWRTTSVGGLIGSIVALILLAVLYEGVKFLRELLSSRALTQKMQESDEKVTVATTRSGLSAKERAKTWIRTVELNMWSRSHAVQTSLHLVQLTLSYLLMLVVMTFNVWLCAAVILGLTLGYFLFGWKKTVVLEHSGECCH